MGELVFVCPWPAGGEKLGQVEEGGGRVPTFPFPFLGVGSLPLVLCPAVDATAPLHLLVAVASPGLNLGPPSLISRDIRDPWQGFCFPAPCHPSTPLHCTPAALPALDSVPESRGWTRRGWCGYTFSVPQCLARRRCYISVCSRYYFLLGGSWHLAASLQHSESVANACQGSGVQ